MSAETDLAYPQPTPEAIPASGMPGNSAQVQGDATPRQSAGTTPAPVTRVRPGFGAASVDLTEEEFKNPAVAKLLYQEIVRLDAELASAKPLAKSCADAEKTAAVLQERLNGQSATNAEREKNRTLGDVSLGGGMGIGCLILGLTPSLSLKAGPTAGLCVVGVLIICWGLFFRIVKK